MSEWISVKDRLPGIGEIEDVLAITRVGFMVAYFGQFGWEPSGASYANYNEGGYGFVFDGEVTHWQPLPKPPEN